MSLRTTVIDAMAALLNAPTIPAGIPTATTEDSLPASGGEGTKSINLRRWREQVERLGKPAGTMVRRRLLVRVDVRASSSATASAAANAEPMLDHVTARLGGARLTVGNTKPEVLEAEIRWDLVQADAGYVLVPVIAVVEYTTAINDATVAA